MGECDISRYCMEWKQGCSSSRKHIIANPVAAILDLKHKDKLQLATF